VETKKPRQYLAREPSALSVKIKNWSRSSRGIGEGGNPLNRI
jgi:hypothetical protein